jgi:mRNA-degrading endonuclease YafQ of YafQ-DinJ toxin-antitoxin module
MDKILIALVMFLICITIWKNGINKEIKKKIEKDLKKILTGKVNPKNIPKDCTKVIAKALPEEYKANQAKIQKGLKKIAEAAAQPDTLADYKSTAKQKKLLA